MRNSLDLAVIGAGPYGLSIAAHLRARGIGHQVFGEPMSMWRDNMPPGMLLKSDCKSSSLSDDGGTLTLEAHYHANGWPYDPARVPVEVEKFVSYGLAFQARFAPDIDRRLVARVERGKSGFFLELDDGTEVECRNVVAATGVLPFMHMPARFMHLPSELVSHSSAFGPLDSLAGKAVTIIGAGSSALDLAALLNEKGSKVTILARAHEIVIQGKPAPHRDIVRRICAPDSKIGTGWRSRICDDAPWLIHALPASVRRRVVDNMLGPSGGYFIGGRLDGDVTIRTGMNIRTVGERGAMIRIIAEDPDGAKETIYSEHLILATGYRLDLSRLAFLSRGLLTEIAVRDRAPVLSASFESSIPGLFFVGYPSAPSFGPVMRFVAGTSHPARKVTARLARERRTVQPG